MDQKQPNILQKIAEELRAIKEQLSNIAKIQSPEAVNRPIEWTDDHERAWRRSWGEE